MKRAMLQGGQGANIQNINQKILSALKIIRPPKELQTKFCDIVVAFSKSRDRTQNAALETDALFNAMSQKAFAGEL